MKQGKELMQKHFASTEKAKSARKKEAKAGKPGVLKEANVEAL